MTDTLQVIRLFPLPGVVLFPRAVLPLHVFEERYKQMVADALMDDGQMAVALLKPGWERKYYDRPEIDPVICVGKIVSHEMLSCGQYNLLLQGLYRGKITEEISGKMYRQAAVRPIEQKPVLEIDLSCERWRLQELFLQAQLGGMGKHYLELISSGLSTPEVADLLAFNLIENAELKQSLLSDSDVIGRVRRIVDQLQAMLPALRHAAGAASSGMN